MMKTTVPDPVVLFVVTATVKVMGYPVPKKAGLAPSTVMAAKARLVPFSVLRRSANTTRQDDPSSIPKCSQNVGLHFRTTREGAADACTNPICRGKADSRLFL